MSPEQARGWPLMREANFQPRVVIYEVFPTMPFRALRSDVIARFEKLAKCVPNREKYSAESTTFSTLYLKIVRNASNVKDFLSDLKQ